MNIVAAVHVLTRLEEGVYQTQMKMECVCLVLALFKMSSFLAISFSISSSVRYTASEKFLGLSSRELSCWGLSELKMRSSERGRIPGSLAVPITVYVLPGHGIGRREMYIPLARVRDKQLEYVIQCKQLE